MLAKLTQKEADEAGFELIEGLITHGEVEPARLFDHAFIVREGFEAGATVVGADATLFDAAETEVVVGYLHDSVVYRGAAKLAILEN